MGASNESALPRSLLACLPYLWSHVVFPGRSQNATAWRWPALLTLLILPGLLLYPCMSFYLFEPDEGRYAEIPREMFEHGEWIVPMLQGEPYLDKPPLLYWLVMLSYSILGVHDWAARLVPALAVHATVLLVYLIGRLGLGERAAFRGALVLTLTPGLMGVGRLLTMDSLLTLWVTLALLSLFEATRTPKFRRGWWLLSALACGLGLLAKGPIVFVLTLPPCWLYRRLAGGGAIVSWGDRFAFVAVSLGLALPWYMALCVARPDFAWHFLWEHNVVRFLQPFDHLEPIWYYLPLLALATLPVTLLILPFVRYLGTADSKTAATRTNELGFALLCGGWCVFFFSLSGCKLPTYILPALPFLGIAAGHFLTHTRWASAAVIPVMASLSLLIQASAHYVIVPWYAEYRSPLSQWRVLAQHCGDPDTAVICYPRACHSVAFYLEREDMGSYRSKDIDQLRQALRENPKTVLLLSHRHSFTALTQVLPPEFEISQAAHFGLPPVPGLPSDWGQRLIKPLGATALNLSDLAVVRRKSLAAGEESEAPAAITPGK